MLLSAHMPVIHRRGFRRLVGLAAAAVLAIWAPAASAGDYSYWYSIQNSQSSKVMEVRAWSTAAGGRVDQWEANRRGWGEMSIYGANQQWTIPLSGQTGSIVNKHSRQCLTTDGVRGSQLFQMPCNGGSHQRWTNRRIWVWDDIFPPFGYTATVFQNPASGLVLDVMHGSEDNGAKIIGWPLNDGQNQHWHLTAEDTVR